MMVCFTTTTALLRQSAIIVDASRKCAGNANANAIRTLGGAPTAAAAATSATPSVLSRRAILQFIKEQQSANGTAAAATAAATQKKNAAATTTKDDDTPWPRKLVLAAYAAAALVIPYTAAWIFSTNDSLRRLVFIAPPEVDETDDGWDVSDPKASHKPTNKYSSSYNYYTNQILDRMRQHFGVQDWENISEPEWVDIKFRSILQNGSSQHSNTNDKIPFKFVDEPTGRIRRQQRLVDARNRDRIAIRFHGQENGTVVSHDDADASAATQSFPTVELPAQTLSRHAAVISAVQTEHGIAIPTPVAMDFPIQKKTDSVLSIEENIRNENAIDHDVPSTVAAPSLSIYSLWHYQASLPQQRQNLSVDGREEKQMSATAWELSRLDYEIAQLQIELAQASSSQRSVDDISAEMQRLVLERRRLAWKQWIPSFLL